VVDIHLLLSNGVMLIGVVDIHLLLSNGVILIGVVATTPISITPLLR
jgi:hypothetical protein